MINLLIKIVAGMVTLMVADLYLPGVRFQGDFFMIAYVGSVIGVLNFFVKPILKIITLPLRILTLGAFSLIINIAIVYFVDLAFYELVFESFWPLFFFIVLLWLVNLFLSIILD